MKIRFLIFILSLSTVFVSSRCEAQSNLGAAEFAMLSPHWPCDTARASETAQGLKELRKAVLWNTFGTETSCLKDYLADPKLKFFQMHLINEPCNRNKNCAPHEFLYGITPQAYASALHKKDPRMMEKLAAYLKEPAELIKKHLKPTTACYISPGLESNLNRNAARVLIDAVRPLFPNCEIVWNPVNINKAAKPMEGTTFEMHGNNPPISPPCLANLDGTDIAFPTRPAILPQLVPSAELPAYIEKYSRCAATFLWIAEFNGLTAGPFMNPRERTKFPSAETFNLVNGIIAQDAKAMRKR